MELAYTLAHKLRFAIHLMHVSVTTIRLQASNLLHRQQHNSIRRRQSERAGIKRFGLVNFSAKTNRSVYSTVREITHLIRHVHLLLKQV